MGVFGPRNTLPENGDSGPCLGSGESHINPDWSHAIFNPCAWDSQFQAWKFQSRLEFSISLDNFAPDLDNSPQKGALISISLKRFNLRLVAWKCQSRSEILNFSTFGPLSPLLRKLLTHKNPEELLSGWLRQFRVINCAKISLRTTQRTLPY